jgi:hypothetical protein
MGSKVIRNVTKILKATSGRLFGRVTAGTGRAEELTPADVRTLLSVSTTAEIAAAYQPIGSYAASVHTHTTADITGFSEAVDDEVASLLVAGTNISITYNDVSNTLTITNTASAGSGDVVGPASAVDNAAVRFDTTTGKLIQDASWIIHDNLTASPNNTVNHACLEATGATTNVSVSIKPKGTGSFSLDVPDGTSTGGNARGAGAVDLQRTRSANTSVASGTNSFLGPGSNGWATGERSTSLCSGRASGNDSFAFRGTASGDSAIAFGPSSTSSNSYTNAFGFGASATALFASAFGVATASAEGSFACGRESNSRIYGSFAFASLGDVSGRGNKQMMMVLLRNSTSGTTPAELFADASSARLTVPSGKVLHAMIFVSGSKNDGSAVATYSRMYAVKNVGGTTSEVFAPQTLGTDTAAGTSIAITANNTNDALQISVTGITGETWRWQAFVIWSEFIWSA